MLNGASTLCLKEIIIIIIIIETIMTIILKIKIKITIIMTIIIIIIIIINNVRKCRLLLATPVFPSLPKLKTCHML